jgi:hypothetical protein
LKNKANGKSASITDAIKKRAERFGDISQAAKINTLNVGIKCFSMISIFIFFRNKKLNVLNDLNQLQVFNLDFCF